MENRYDKYKDSGIAWIGEIPEHWEVCSIKQIMKNKSIKGFPNETVLSLYRDLGVIPKDSREDNHNVTSEDTSNYKFVEEGDFVINKMKAWQGSMAISDYKGIVSPAYYVCKVINSKVDKKYIHYLLRNESYKVEYMRLSTGMRIGQWDLNINDFLQINTIIPSVLEQQSIATYLDQKCGEIDELITLQEEMITKLQSYKQSVITEAVTKGLDKNVPLKDSGIEWIGEIPEHWNSYRIKYHFSVISGSGFKNEIQGCTDGEIPVCKASDISNAGKEIFKSSNYLSREIAIKEGFNIIPVGSILFPKIGEAMKKNNRSIAMIECCLDNNCQALIPSNINCIYSYYIFKIIDMSWYDNGGTIPSINNQKLINSFIPYPPLSEQQAIADYLDQRCSEIDELISIKQQKIEKLKEYKKSLIFECVTGKRKVS